MRSTIPTLRRKPPTRSPCTWRRRSTPRCSVSTKRRRFRRSTASTPAPPAVARASGAPRLRIRAARHPLALRRAEHSDRRGDRADRRAAHERRLSDVPHGRRRVAAAATRDPHHSRQSLGPQDAGGGAFLAQNGRVQLHFTPTYSSWLNQVELWFAKMERDILARGIFTSVANPKRKIMKYIRHYNKVPKLVRWTYANPRGTLRKPMYISCVRDCRRTRGRTSSIQLYV